VVNVIDPNRHPTLKPGPPWRRQAKRQHDTLLPFNFKYFLSAGFDSKVWPTRCGAADSAGIASVALRDRRRELDGQKQLNAGTPDIFHIEKKLCGDFHRISSAKATRRLPRPCLARDAMAIARRLIQDDRIGSGRAPNGLSVCRFHARAGSVHP